MRIVAWLLVAAGLVVTGIGVAAALGQAGSGVQPWGNELSDNFVFIKALPFVLGFGVAVGLLMANTYGAKVRADGAVRRWSPGTVFGHWVLTLGFVLALPTGMWQYLGGILDVNLPIPLYLFYRVHYIGASIVLFAVAAFVSYLWMTGDRSLLIRRGEWSRHLLGLAYELPSWSILLALITVTGLIKAGRYLIPVPGFVLWLASTLHVAAMVAIVIKLLDHLRYTFPRWSLMGAITTTWLKEQAPARRQGASEPSGS